jgi:hypothetical protein
MQLEEQSNVPVEKKSPISRYGSTTVFGLLSDLKFSVDILQYTHSLRLSWYCSPTEQLNSFLGDVFKMLEST